MFPTRTYDVGEAEAQVSSLAVRLVSLAETLDLVPESSENGVDREQLTAAFDAFARAGVARRSPGASGHVTPARLVEALHEALTAIEESPMPGVEWEPLTRLVGEEPLAQLVGTSVSSVHRYRTGERPTPDDVAARLHEVALIVADLSGSYNEFGIRRWFHRRRSALGGASPADILAGPWSPDDERVQHVRVLARALLGSPAT